MAYRDRARDGPLIRLLFESAVRVAEASRLDAADVDAAERTVTVIQGKGGKDWLVFMTEDLAQLVRPHLDGRPRGPLFLSTRGTRLSVRRIQTIVHAAARRDRPQADLAPHAPAHLGHGRAERRDAARQRPGAARACRPEDDPALHAAGDAPDPQEYDAAMAAIAGMAPGPVAPAPSDGRARIGA